MRRKPHIGLIVLAGGTGTRFLHKTPKQYLRPLGLPMFVSATLPFLSACKGELASIVITCPAAYRAQTIREVRRNFRTSVPISVVAGGKERIDSLFRGIHHLREHSSRIDIIMSHDAARPLIRPSDIKGFLRHFTRNAYDASILSRSLSESLFVRTKHDRIAGVNREKYCIGESPDAFRMNVAAQMYNQWAHLTHTLHGSVHIIELISRHKRYRIGSYKGKHINIKLTNPADKVLARMYAKEQRGRESL